jgi:hypothetical protein
VFFFISFFLSLLFLLCNVSKSAQNALYVYRKAAVGTQPQAAQRRRLAWRAPVIAAVPGDSTHFPGLDPGNPVRIAFT